MFKIASLLLRKNSIPFDKEELSFQIESHPSYPSLHSITGVLDHFNIENVAAKVPVNTEVLNQLPNSFIAQVNGDQGLKLVLLEKQKTNYIIHSLEGKKEKVSTQRLLELFTGIIVAVEKDENSQEKPKNKKLLNTIGFFIASISILGVLFLSEPSIATYTSLLISVVGVLVSISIVKQEFGIKNAIGDTFCSSESEKKDCNAVLTSKGANIFKNLKLSDLSLIYFIGISLSILLLGIQKLNLDLIYIISLLSIPITLYSIYYQAFVVKTWCLLCLSIVGILWLQAGIPFVLDSFSFAVDFQPIEGLILLLSFTLAFSIWNFLKPKFSEFSENKQYKLDYYKFKRKFSLFSTLLGSKPGINTSIQDDNEIVYGNPRSNLEIVIITNPFCGHCKPVHTIIEDIIHQHKDIVKVRVRFNINLRDLEGDVVKITTNLMSIHETEGQEVSLKAMDEAYNVLSPAEWIEKWGKYALNSEQYIKTLNRQKDWCTDHKINFTPEILINGYSFPKEYDREDLKFFIEELSEKYNEAVLETATENAS
ncbi:vitamin K epoxide reductase family protein [Pseudotenacibaculum haliotis]|uniref:Vitamin K epoxide reductase family protein n=1 Tax=Pseudotenacibaculum haliotis TaxID=1862138 RepID=A0ABW5LRA7_9FLAO